MRLTEVRINLCGGPSSRLKAFCSLTFDNTFVIRDVKLIDGNDDSGGTKLFLAMPSRKLTDHCRRCGEKNHLKARFCNGCGSRLDENRSMQQHGTHGHNGHGRIKLHADIAHPINAHARAEIERQIFAAYERELVRSREPGYVPTPMETDVPELMSVKTGAA